MPPALLTPMRLLGGIAVFTFLCMLAIAAVTDHLVDTYLFRSAFTPPSRVHLVDDVTLALKRAQECRQAYLATGDNSYLDAYRVACSDVGSSMDRLMSEDQDVTNNLAHAKGFREFVQAKLSAIGTAIEFTPTEKTVTAIPATDSDLARTQKLLDSLGQGESRDISGALATAQARTAFHRNLMIALVVINILFLGGVAFCASQMGKLYALITVCSWSKRVHYQNQWIPLEEYMSKRFGVRISHGISQEEYEKWFPANNGEEQAVPPPFVTQSPTSKAAA